MKNSVNVIACDNIRYDVTIRPYKNLSDQAETAMGVDKGQKITKPVNQAIDMVAKVAYATSAELTYVVDPRIKVLESNKDLVASLSQEYNRLNTRVESLEKLDGSESIKVGPQLMGSESTSDRIVSWSDTDGKKETRSLSYGPTDSLDHVVDGIHEPLALGLNAHEARISALESSSGNGSGIETNKLSTQPMGSDAPNVHIITWFDSVGNKETRSLTYGATETLEQVFDWIHEPLAAGINAHETRISALESGSGDISNADVTYTKTYYRGAEPTKYTDSSQTGKLSDVLSTIYELAAEGAEDNIQNRICHYTLSDGRQFDGPLGDHLARIQQMNDQFTQGFMTEIAPVIQSNTESINTLRNDVDKIQIQADAVTDISAKKVSYTKSNFDEASGMAQTYSENDEISDVLTEMSSEIASAKNISNLNVSYYTSDGSRQSDTLSNHIKNLNTKTSNKFNELKQAILDDLDYIWGQLRAIHPDLPEISSKPWVSDVAAWNTYGVTF